MRKSNVFIVMLLLLVFMVGCSFNVELGADKEEKEKEKETKDEKLALYLTKADEDAGVTLDDPTYQNLNKTIQNSPDLGAKNDFSVYTVEPVKAGDNNWLLFLVGVNRLSDPIENIRFDLTVKNEKDEAIIENEQVLLGEEVGAFPVNGVKPFLLDITEEQATLLEEMDMNGSVLEINNFKYD